MKIKLDVYWHSRLRKFSVKHKGRVAFHCKQVCLIDPVGTISQSGYKRKLREGVKNVYATIRGVLDSRNKITPTGTPVVVRLEEDRWLPTDRGSYAELSVSDDGKPIVRFWK